MQLINDTPFEAERLISTDKDGYETLIVAAKAIFALPSRSERSVTATDPEPFLHSHVHVGDPGSSSIRYEADIGAPKPSTDVVLCGHAYAQRVGQSHVDVSLRVGRLSKIARVFGDRRWERVMGVAAISKPKPFRRIPLLYEKAFGGADVSHENPKYHEFEPRNPVGVGFRSSGSQAHVVESPLPNIEDPRQQIARPGDRPAPHGFGFVAEHWSPRARFQGTYDDEWQKSRMPLLPHDFDDRFYNAASPGLVASDFLQGGEPVEVKNATPDGYLGFYLPTVQISASALIEAATVPVELKINTVMIDTDVQKLSLVWRGMIRVHDRIEDVRWVHLESKAVDRGRKG